MAAMPIGFALSCVLGLVGVSLLAALSARRRFATPLTYGACLVLSVLQGGFALRHLVAAAGPIDISLPLGLPWLGAHFRVDPLSALFLVVVSFGAAAASLYAIGYGRHEPAPGRVLPFYPAFLAGMNLVLLADDAFTFLLSWEFMSLSSWALVIAHHRGPGNVRAGYVYLLMAGAGTMALLLAFGLLSGAEGGYGFAQIRASHLAPWVTAASLVLALIGAGSKAGMAPLHVWLPLAHPAAPSHVSALMSGVMTKVAVYGFLRIVFDLLGPPDWWWGLLVTLTGAGTALLGVLFALVQTDLKRVLAYSTIENVGFIFVGLGLTLAYQANQLTAAAALALTAALFHVINHALFKCLLFFGAGAVLAATGTRDMDRLGGLIHRMPATAAAVLVGCAAISALPPLNGFAAEWLALQAILKGPLLPQWGLKFAVLAVGGLFALTAALAAACFVRLFGIAFLGRPRSAAAAAAREVDRWSLAAMAVCAGLCLAAGILPGVVIDGLAPVVLAIVGDRMPAQLAMPWLSIQPLSDSPNRYNGLLLLLFIAGSALAAVVAIHRLASRAARRAPAWDCGYPDPSPATQYGADSFSQPIRRVYGSLVFQAREQIDLPPPGDVAAARFSLTLHDPVWERVYVPLADAIQAVGGRINQVQFLTIRRYLAMVFLSLVILLIGVAAWP